MDNIKAKKIALQVSVITIIVNFLLTAFKFIAGILGNSSAITADAVHSFSDVISTIIVIIGVIIASKPQDNLHQYGHERIECVASILLAVLLFATGALLGYNGVVSIINKSYKNNDLTPTMLALIASIVSIVVKEAMYWYTYINAKRINSISLKASAWHHRSDALSSVGSLIGIALSIFLGWKIADVIASIIICIVILKVAIDIFLEAINKMVDKSCPPEKIDEIISILTSIDGVLSVDEVKTRMFGNKIYVDIEIGAYEQLTLLEAHAIAEKAHHLIEQSDENIKHCMVHVNPKKKEN